MQHVRALNRFAFVASLVLAAVAFWNRNELPSSKRIMPALGAEPRQQPTARQPFTVDYASVRYTVEPHYEYDLRGMIVSYRQHDGESRMHRFANDRLNAADLCVVWGSTAASPHLARIAFWNGIFTCNFQTSDQAAWDSIRLDEIANNHLIAADAAIRDRVADLRIGDQIRIRGWLASYGSGAAKRGTSTTRNDTGDGACETIFVNELEIIEPARNPWRAVLYTALALLALTVLVHFRLPYRPYG